MHQPDVEEFLLNESFVRYCLGTAVEAEHSYWTVFQQQHPSQQPAMAQARDMIMAMYQWGLQHEIAEEQIKLQQQIQATQVVALPKQRRRIWGYAAAAAIAAALLAGAWLFSTSEKLPAYITIQTGVAQVKHITLPDSSQVWLNANTTLQYAGNFTTQRKLVLKEGEVFCRVTHNAAAPFIITTASGLQVKDLGTAFSVKSYQALPREQVGVTEGMVAVGHAQQQRQLHQGDGLAINKQNGTVTAYQVQEEEMDWITGRMVLNDADFPTFLLALENQYGVKVQVKDNTLMQCRITASFAAGESVQAILDNLQLVYGISYTIRQNEIVLHGKGCN